MIAEMNGNELYRMNTRRINAEKKRETKFPKLV